MVLLSEVELHATYWIIALRCSIDCIISLWSLRDIRMFSVFFTCSRKKS